MRSLIVVVLTAVAVCFSETCCDTLPAPITSIVKAEDVGFSSQANASRVIDRGFFLRSLGNLRKPTKTAAEEPKDLDSVSNEANKRKARLLGGLAFLAGLSFGGLATAASSSVKTLAKMPQATFTLNLGPAKTSPYLAAYYSPYSLVPHPLLYPVGLLPATNPSKLSQVLSSHDDSKPQVISVFDNRQPDDYAESNEEEYADQKKNPADDDKRVVADAGEDRAELHRPELRVEADRNAEEKEAQRKHGNFLKGSFKERQDLQVDADDLLAALKETNTTDTNEIRNRITTTTRPYTYPKPTRCIPQILHHIFHKPTNNTTEHNSTEHLPGHFSGYFEGYPQDISHVDLTTGSDAYHYQDHGQINYNLPYERPASFYRDDVYSNYHHGSPYFPGPYSTDQINGYVGADFGREYPSEYQPPYASGFKPINP